MTAVVGIMSDPFWVKQRLQYDEILRLQSVEEGRGTPITQAEIREASAFVRAFMRGWQSK